MMKKKKKKMWLVYLVLLPVCLVVGWAGGIILSNMPFSIDAVTGEMLWCTGASLGMLFGFVVWFVIVAYISADAKRKFVPGREFGDAEWGDVDQICEQISVDPATDRPLTQHLHMGMDDRITKRNANCMVIGGPGSGKTFNFVVPALLKCSGSYAILDPKGDLCRNYTNYLLCHEYKVFILDIQNPVNSTCSFNPFLYLRSNSDVTRLFSDLQRSVKPPNATTSDPFWDEASLLLMESLTRLMFLAFPDDCTMRRFLVLLNLCQPPQEQKKESSEQQTPEIEQLFAEHLEDNRVVCQNADGTDFIITGKQAFDSYKASILECAPDTAKSVLVSCRALFSRISNNLPLVELLSGDKSESINFRAFGAGYEGHLRKSALFMVVSDSDSTYSFLTLWITNSMFAELYEEAKTSPGNRLPIHVSVILDEFCNVGFNSEFTRILSTNRSRGIGIVTVCQAVSQLKYRFKEEHQSLIADCDTILYLGSNESDTHELFSKMLGKRTIQKKSYSKSKGASGSSSESIDSLGLELLTPDQIRLMEKAIVFIRGYRPIMDDKIDTISMPEFLEAQSYGEYDFTVSEEPECFGALNAGEMEYVYRHNIPVISFTSDELEVLAEGKDFSPVDYDAYLNQAAMQIWMKLHQEQTLMQEELEITQKETLKDLLMEGAFTDEQIAEANAGLEAGLTEEQVLGYFRPEYSAARMRALRLLMRHGVAGE